MLGGKVGELLKQTTVEQLAHRGSQWLADALRPESF